jgi:hypothetical protein
MLCGDESLLPINTSSPGFIVRVCGLKIRVPLSFLVIIITPAKDELFGIAVVFVDVDVTEYTRSKIPF